MPWKSKVKVLTLIQQFMGEKTMMFCTLDVANVAQSGVQDWLGERFSCSYERNWKQVFMLQDILHFSNKEFNPELSGSKLAIGANVG